MAENDRLIQDPDGVHSADPSSKTKNEEARERDEKIAEYIIQAKACLEDNNFGAARGYISKALKVDDKNSVTIQFLIRIDETEAAKIAEKKRAKEDARKEKIRKNREKIEREKEKAKARAAGILAKKEERAAKIAEKKRAKEEAKKEKIRKNREKIKREKEKAKARAAKLQEEKKRKSIDAKAKKKALRAKRLERRKPQVEKYISRSRKYLSRENYSDARKYAYRAQELSPQNGDVAALITDINKAEMFVGKKLEEKKRKETVIKRVKKHEARKKSPMKKYDEGKSWTERIAGVFGSKTYDPGDAGIQEEHVYSVDECIQLALRRSQRMVMSDKQLKLAEMRVWENRRDLLPSITGKYELSTGKISANSYRRHYRGKKYQVEVDQTLFDGMGTYFTVKQAQTNLDIVKIEQEKIKNEIIEETRKAYYSLDKAVKALDVQAHFKEKVNYLYDIADKSFQQELISRVEYLKIKGQSLQADFQYVSSEEDAKLAEMILFQAINIDPVGHIKIKAVEKPSERVSIGLENCYRVAFANRPDFRIKEKMIEYYNYERKMAKSKAWPKIEFNGSFGASYENFEPLFLDADHQSDDAGSPSRAGRNLEAEWFAGAKASVPFWGNTLEYNYVKERWAPTVSSFRGAQSATSYFNVKLLDDLAYFSNLFEARAGFEGAKYEYVKAREEVTMEVKELYFKYRKAVLQMDVTRAQVEHQTRFVDVLEERRKYGEMEASKVIEEYEKLAEYEYGEVQGDASYFISLAELSRAIGVPDYFIPFQEGQSCAALEEEPLATKDEI